jgi:hypothetical protein
MPVKYDIFPDVALVLYICTGNITPEAFFSVGDFVASDPRYSSNMIIIIDFFSAEIDVHVSDLSLAVGKFNEANQRDKKIGKTAVLTKSTALTFLGETLKSLSLDTINNFGIFHTKKDVIIWLGLPEEDVLRYWAETINRA